jgi:Ca2+-binding RTX toxin-like protein
LGFLTLDEVAIVDNMSSNVGGGVVSRSPSGGSSSLTLKNSTVDSNRSKFGSGIRVDGAASVLTIERSTISNNRALDGLSYSEAGGLSLVVGASGSALISNSTFSGNYAMYGGGIRAGQTSAPIDVINSTIAYNESVAGGGIALVESGTAIKVRNSIVAQNTASYGAAYRDVNGTLHPDSSHSFFSSGTGGTDLSGSSLHNKIGLPSTPWDARLAPLANYGGATLTHVLLPSSPAINSGNSSYVSALGGIEQRNEGRPRILGTSVDMGAVEAQVVQATPTGPVYVYGTDGPDELHLYSAGTQGKVSVDSTPGIEFDVALGTASLVKMSGGTGDDDISVDANVSTDVTIEGDGGDDTLRGGSGNDTISGGNDDDMLIGGAGDDQLNGGDGRDQIGGGEGNDTVIVSPSDSYQDDRIYDADQPSAVSDTQGHVNRYPNVQQPGEYELSVGNTFSLALSQFVSDLDVTQTHTFYALSQLPDWVTLQPTGALLASPSSGAAWKTEAIHVRVIDSGQPHFTAIF